MLVKHSIIWVDDRQRFIADKFNNQIYYRPQTKFAKVMFLHVSVILFTGVGEGVLSQHALKQVSRREGTIPACFAGFQAHTQGGKLRGIWPGGSPGPQPRGKLRGIWPGGSAPEGVPAPGGSVPRGVPAPGGRVETPRDGYCCGRYTSYCNVFLFNH